MVGIEEGARENFSLALLRPWGPGVYPGENHLCHARDEGGFEPIRSRIGFF